MASSASKDNANPTILAVNTCKKSRRKMALQFSDLAAISADPLGPQQHCHDGGEEEEDENLHPSSSVTVVVDRSPNDRAILQALTEAAAASKGKGVSLLRNIGLVIPETFSKSGVPPPFLQQTSKTVKDQREQKDNAPSARDPITADEIFEIIRNIQDPEHPLTLEQLAVVSREQIVVRDMLDVSSQEEKRAARGDDDKKENAPQCSTLEVRFTPTVPHCSMATQIGLCLRVKLDRSLPRRFKTTVRIEPGTHASEKAINKQLADKERVCAALENKHLLGIVNKCIINGMTGEMS